MLTNAMKNCPVFRRRTAPDLLLGWDGNDIPQLERLLRISFRETPCSSCELAEFSAHTTGEGQSITLCHQFGNLSDLSLPYLGKLMG